MKVALITAEAAHGAGGSDQEARRKSGGGARLDIANKRVAHWAAPPTREGRRSISHSAATLDIRKRKLAADATNRREAEAFRAHAAARSKRGAGTGQTEGEADRHASYDPKQTHFAPRRGECRTSASRPVRRPVPMSP